MRRAISTSLFFLIVVVAIVPQAAGDEFKLTPSISIKEEYNDNILYTTSGTQQDFVSTVSPELTLKNRTERLDISLSGKVDRRIYKRNSDLNSTDQFYEGTGKYALTQRLNLSGRVYYSSDSRPDRDLTVTGLPLTGTNRKRRNYTLSGEYVISETTMAILSTDYLKDVYDSTQFVDLETFAASLVLSHDLSYFLRSTQASLALNYSKYTMTSLDLDNYETTLGVSRALNEKWSIVLNGGARYTASHSLSLNSLGVEERQTSNGWGAVGQLALKYKGEYDYANVSAVHNIMPASGRTGATERTAFTFDIGRKITKELNFTMSGGLFLNRSQAGQFSSQKINEDTFNITPGLRYEFSKDMVLDTSYTYSITQYNDTDPKLDAHRNLFQLRFRMQGDLIE